jgi:hypothetical protein
MTDLDAGEEARVGPTTRARRVAVATLLPAALLLTAAGCGPAPGGQAGREASPSLASASQAGYLAPPGVVAVQARDGVLRLRGSAPPRSTVELVSPEGERLRVGTDAGGVWRARLPAGGRPRLYAVSTLSGGRAIHADGALVLAPGALAPAVTVRAGEASLPLLRTGATTVATVDYDPSGVMAVAGSAPPGAALNLLVDGAPAAVGQADGQGRYALLAANHRLGLGPHRLELRTPGGTTARDVVLQPPEPLTTPYLATAAPGGGWRVEWGLTGGGEQTTLILPP